MCIVNHVRYKSVLELAAKTQLIRTLYISTKLSFLTVMYVYNDSNKAPSDQSQFTVKYTMYYDTCTGIYKALTYLSAIFADHQGPDIVRVSLQLHQTGNTVPGVVHLERVLRGPRDQHRPRGVHGQAVDGMGLPHTGDCHTEKETTFNTLFMGWGVFKATNIIVTLLFPI